jgi:hypothetical protein
MNFFYVGRSFDALAARARTGVFFGRPPSRTGTSAATTAATIAAAGAAGPGNRARTPISMIIRITVAIQIVVMIRIGMTTGTSITPTGGPIIIPAGTIRAAASHRQSPLEALSRSM